MTLGLSHITFIVKDLERSSLFFEKIFGAKQIYSSGERTFSLSREKFFLIGEVWICIMEGDDEGVGRTYNHVAFQIEQHAIPEYRMWLKEIGVEMKPERPRVDGEGDSLYFYDFDNHLFELHTGTLDARLSRYATGRWVRREPRRKAQNVSKKLLGLMDGPSTENSNFS